jgi:double-stranded uracil-DNA glycosylase
VAESASSGQSSAVPDVLGPDLDCVFCGINPGRVSAAAAAHFANPRNDFWRLLHDAGFTPRLYAPAEQFGLLELGLGLTNAAYRTTPGSGDLRRGDFDSARLAALAEELQPRAIAFVGKEAYRGAFGVRPALGPQASSLGDTALYVLPSTSPANAAVPYAERLRWFRALRVWIEREAREAVRAVLVDGGGRVLLLSWENPSGRWWITPGGGVHPGETEDAALHRELLEEAGLAEFEIGPLVFERSHVIPWGEHLVRQHERYYLVRVDSLAVEPTIDLAEESVTGHRWWTLDELDATDERIAPPQLAGLVRSL